MRGGLAHDGDATAVVRVEVSWPASGLHQAFESVPLDSTVVVREDQREIAIVERAPLRFRRR